MDYDRNGEINYSEFLASTVGGEHLTHQNLFQLFKFLDTEKEEKLSAPGLAKVFKRAGKKFQLEEIKKMLEDVGLESGVSYEQFLQLMTSFLPK